MVSPNSINAKYERQRLEDALARATGIMRRLERHHPDGLPHVVMQNLAEHLGHADAWVDWLRRNAERAAR